MEDDETMIFTLNVGSDKRVVESGIRVKKSDLREKPDVVKERLKERFNTHVDMAVDQLFGPEKEDAVPAEPQKQIEPTVEEPPKKEEPVPEPPVVEKPAEVVEEKKEESVPVEEKKENNAA